MARHGAVWRIWLGLALAGGTACSPAVAAEGPDVDGLLAGWARLAAGRPGEAAEVAVDMLRQDAGNLAAHELYLAAHIEGWGDGVVLVEQYRAWHRGNSGDPTRRIALSLALLYGTSHRALGMGFERATQDDEGLCEEVREVLPETGRGVVIQSALAHVRIAWGRACGRKDLGAWDQLGTLAEADGLSAYRMLGWRLTEPEVDHKAVEELELRVAGDPRVMRLVVDFALSHPTDDGPTRRAEKGLQKALEVHLEADDPTMLELTAAALTALGDPRGLEVAERLFRLDSTKYPEPPPEALAAAERAGSAEEALRLLGKSAEVGEEGWRARAEQVRGDALLRLNRAAEAQVAYGLALDAKPRAEHLPQLALAFGTSALRTGKDVERALAAIEDALAGLDASTGLYPPAVAGDVGGRSAQRQARGALHTLAAELLVKVGRREEALAAWQRALVVAPDAEGHLRMGELLLAMGRQGDAAEELIEGLRLGSEDVELVERSRVALEDAFFGVGYWHADGALGYVKARQRASEREMAGGAHPLDGLRFPITSFERLDGDRLEVGEAATVMVVALWTTDCRGCDEAMTLLEQLVARWGTEITAVALNVDQARETSVAWFAGRPKPGFHRAWDPRAADVLRAERVPAIYVVGANRRVARVVQGMERADRVAVEAAVAAETARAR
jgi:tetratricopeptide (TPR) repeat protein